MCIVTLLNPWKIKTKEVDEIVYFWKVLSAVGKVH